MYSSVQTLPRYFVVTGMFLPVVLKQIHGVHAMFGGDPRKEYLGLKDEQRGLDFTYGLRAFGENRNKVPTSVRDASFMAQRDAQQERELPQCVVPNPTIAIQKPNMNSYLDERQEKGSFLDELIIQPHEKRLSGPAPVWSAPDMEMGNPAQGEKMSTPGGIPETRNEKLPETRNELSSPRSDTLSTNDSGLSDSDGSSVCSSGDIPEDLKTDSESGSESGRPEVRQESLEDLKSAKSPSAKSLRGSHPPRVVRPATMLNANPNLACHAPPFFT